MDYTMKKLFVLLAALGCAFLFGCTPASAGSLDITGKLVTADYVVDVPLSVSWNTTGSTLDPWGQPVEVGYTVANPANDNVQLTLPLGQQVFTEQNDFDYPVWPGLVFETGGPIPIALDFFVSGDNNTWQLMASGPIHVYAGETVVQLALYGGMSYEDFAVAKGLAMRPVEVIPEPATLTFVSCLLLIGLCVVRRR